jgi:hypothetical protein
VYRMFYDRQSSFEGNVFNYFIPWSTMLIKTLVFVGLQYEH